MQSIQRTLCCIEEPLQQFFPSTEADVRCDCTFGDPAEVFGITDTSPAFIQRPNRHQKDYYYSGKDHQHSVPVQALVIADG
jgi:hypothetical protein